MNFTFNTFAIIKFYEEEWERSREADFSMYRMSKKAVSPQVIKVWLTTIIIHNPSIHNL